MADPVQAPAADPGSPLRSPGVRLSVAGGGVRIRTRWVAATAIVTVSGEIDLMGSYRPVGYTAGWYASAAGGRALP
jgi:hypothetical protein